MLSYNFREYNIIIYHYIALLVICIYVMFFYFHSRLTSIFRDCFMDDKVYGLI
ncbi:hypothetical protein XIS1_480098 [Xenorhabdus innexi]|uniref:Uncharacterized protein n=1 Tax=Xenorhabdus innexi TaxID=290109 RepID=A0A1N6MYU0_9GAMM|nr:hypothetical protein XIS1_480098 [Xenorhabdus innexi]